MNLVSLAMQLLGPMVINRIASSLGLSQGIAGKLISAAIPAILAGLTGKAAQPGGATSLTNVLSKFDPSILGNLENIIGGPQQQQFTDQGTSALSSLLGGNAVNAIAGALGKFGGVDTGKSSSLLGMLAPVVLGTLSQQQKASGLDAGGVANLLASQKENIAAAMPTGFSDLLKGTGVLDSISSNVARAATPRTPQAPADSGGLGRWLIPLVALLIAAYLLWNFLNRGTPEPTAPPAHPASTEAPAPAPAAPQADLAGLANKAISALTGSLATITDEATARAAVPQLQDAGKQVDALKSAAALLSGDARAPLAGLIHAALPGVTSAIEKATGIPGVAAIIEPVVAPIVANLTELSK